VKAKGEGVTCGEAHGPETQYIEPHEGSLSSQTPAHAHTHGH